MPMRWITRTLAIALVMIGTAGMAGTVVAAQPAGPAIIDLSLTGVVDPFVRDYIAGNLQRARDQGAGAVLLRIDTPGGLGSATDSITQAILASEVPVICYVSPLGARAASAGAFILLSCPVAAMAPGTHVGASTPIGLSGGDLGDKIMQDAAASIRALAQTYGRNPDVAETFVTQAKSITAEEALNENVIDTISPSAEQLLSDLDGRTITLGTGAEVTLATAGAPLQPEGIGGFVGFLHSLLDPSLAFLFFWLGLALIVLELLIPGHVFSGTVGTIMLILSVVSFGLLPVRIIGIALLVCSVIAYVIELKAPGLGIWGAIGTISLVLGGWFLYDRAGGVEVSPWVILPVAVVMTLFFGLVVSKVLAIRKMPPAQSRNAIVGMEGVAVASGVDRHGGNVRVASEEWQAVSPAGPIEAGRKVRVVSLDGLVLTVEPLDPEHASAGPLAPVEEGGNT
jgi:membrane-bound serine protease (ClpP class)